MLQLDHLLRTGSELSRREALLSSFLGSLRQTAFMINGSPLCGICLSLCDSKHLASSSSATMGNPVFPQAISTSCPEDIHRLLRTAVHDLVTYVFVQNKPICWDCSARQSHAQWYNRSEMLAFRCRKKKKRRKAFPYNKDKSLNSHGTRLDRHWQGKDRKSDRQCRVHQGGSKVNWLWSGFNLLIINPHISHLSCTTPLFICRCWIGELL